LDKLFLILVSNKNKLRNFNNKIFVYNLINELKNAITENPKNFFNVILIYISFFIGKESIAIMLRYIF